MKTLEDEVLRLKESFTTVSQDKERLAEENKHLKALLRQNGIVYGGVDHQSPTVPSLGYTSSGSVSGNSYQPGSQSAFTPPLTSQSLASSISPPLQVPLSARSNPSPGRSPGPQQPQQLQQAQNPPVHGAEFGQGLDYEQAGIDFVLRYVTWPLKCVPLPRLVETVDEVPPCTYGYHVSLSTPQPPFNHRRRKYQACQRDEGGGFKFGMTT